MPRTLHNALTEKAIRDAAAKSAGRLVRLVDGRGLRLVILPTGRRRWELRYQPGSGKEVSVDLGDHPAVSIPAARLLAEEARVGARADGRKGPVKPETFEGALRRYVAARRATDWRADYADDSLRRLEINAVPLLGHKLIGDVRRADVRDVLDPIIQRNSLVQARRIRTLIEQMYAWLIARDEVENNPAGRELLTMLPKPKTPDDERHHAAPDHAQAPTIYRAIREYPSPITSLAMRWTVLNAARTSETRLATFDEIDEAAKTWTLPAARMKANRAHVVPLSDEAWAVYLAAKAMRKRGCSLIFPTPNANKPLSPNGMLFALQRTLGFDFTMHGLARATFSTWARETRAAPRDVVEMCLAHAIEDQTEAAYNRAELLSERRKLLQKWARFLIGPK